MKTNTRSPDEMERLGWERHRLLAKMAANPAQGTKISLAKAMQLCRKLGINSKSAPYRGYRVKLADGRAISCDPDGSFTLHSV